MCGNSATTTHGTTSTQCRAKRRVPYHRYAGVSSTRGFPALSPRYPPTTAHTSTSPPQEPPQQLLQGGDVEIKPGPALRCGVGRKSTTVKAVICCSCQKSIHQCCSGMTRTMQEQWRQAIMTIGVLTVALSQSIRSCAANVERSSESTTAGQRAESAKPQRISNAQP